MRQFNIIKKLEQFTYVLEIILTVLLAIGIAIGLIDIIRYFGEIFLHGLNDSYEVFKNFLAHTLLLAIGIELMLMLLYHSTNSILELILFLIARKMLVYANTMFDLLLGTIAIAIVFVILKYLAPKKDFVSRKDREYSASKKVSEVQKETGLDIPTDRGNTLGGLVCSLANEACQQVEQGAEFKSGDIRIKIVKATEGVIERVMIMKENSEENSDENETEGSNIE
jgi:predicted membrane protein